MMIIGITGGIGSGKSTVVKFFADLANAAVYIADKEAKELMSTSKNIQQAIIKEFGEKAYENNVLNRTFLSEIVFKDKSKLASLNAIVHPEVYKHFNEFVKKNSKKDFILYENAILFENNSNHFCNVIITVVAPKEVRIKRVLKRDKTTRNAVVERMNNQWSQEKKALQSNYIIKNISLEETQKSVLKIYKTLTKNRQLIK